MAAAETKELEKQVWGQLELRHVRGPYLLHTTRLQRETTSRLNSESYAIIMLTPLFVPVVWPRVTDNPIAIGV